MNDGKSNKWAIWLAGCLFTIVCVIGFPTLIGYVIANDKESRERDTKMEYRLGESVKEGFRSVIAKMDGMSVAQQKMEISIKGIEKDIEYMKQNGR